MKIFENGDFRNDFISYVLMTEEAVPLDYFLEEFELSDLQAVFVFSNIHRALMMLTKFSIFFPCLPILPILFPDIPHIANI